MVINSSFTITTTKYDQFYKLSDCIENTNKLKYQNKYNLNEWVYKFEYYNCILIIPCQHVFQITYGYALDIQKALLIGSLEDLYYEITSFTNNSITIKCSNKVSISSIELLVKLLTNKNMLNKFSYHFFQIATKQYSNETPYFKTHFLYEGTFQISTTIQVLKNYKEDKELCFVHSIDETSIPYFHKEINYTKMNLKQSLDSKYKNYKTLPLRVKNKFYSNIWNNFSHLVYNENKYHISVKDIYKDSDSISSKNIFILVIEYKHSYYYIVISESSYHQSNIMIFKDLEYNRYIKKYYRIFYTKHYHPILKVFLSKDYLFKNLKKFVYNEYGYIAQEFNISLNYLTRREKRIWEQQFIQLLNSI